jgi:hypothetical protein
MADGSWQVLRKDCAACGTALAVASRHGEI